MKNLLLSSSFGLLIAISAGMLNLANAADFQKGLLAYFKVIMKQRLANGAPWLKRACQKHSIILAFYMIMVRVCSVMMSRL